MFFFLQNGTDLSVFQMVGLPKFRSHLKSRPFANQPLFDHSKSRLALISDPHCSPVFRSSLHLPSSTEIKPQKDKIKFSPLYFIIHKFGFKNTGNDFLHFQTSSVKTTSGVGINLFEQKCSLKISGPSSS